jgi:cytochrome c5
VRYRNLYVILIVFLVLLASSLIAACGVKGTPAKEPTAPAALDGKTLVGERCTVCHGLDRVTGAAKTRDGWKATVERMVANGAKLDQAEHEAVIDYLAETYPE